MQVEVYCSIYWDGAVGEGRVRRVRGENGDVYVNGQLLCIARCCRESEVEARGMGDWRCAVWLDLVFLRLPFSGLDLGARQGSL